MMKNAFVRVAAAATFCAVVLGAAPARSSDDKLQFVLILSRHGVRTPTHPDELAKYASRPWPALQSPPGNLTPHGALLMRQFGAYYRQAYAGLGIFAGGCPPAGSVFVWADVDQRTRATGDALAAGLAPGCAIPVQSAQGGADPLFDPLTSIGKVDGALSLASLRGAIGDDPAALVTAYAAQLSSLENVLCPPPATCAQLSAVPSTIDSTGDGGLSELGGGLDLAGTATENLLLQYANGDPAVGWGRLDRPRLTDLLKLEVLKKRIEQNWYASRAMGSNVLAHIADTIEQAASGNATPGTQAPVSARFVAIVGHDTTLAEMAGLLRLSWLVDGYPQNDTPPGSALIFELHRHDGGSFVRVYYAAQSLDDMRRGTGSAPVRVPVYVPGCPSLECPLADFKKAVDVAVDPNFVGAW